MIQVCPHCGQLGIPEHYNNEGGAWLKECFICGYDEYRPRTPVFGTNSISLKGRTGRLKGSRNKYGYHRWNLRHFAGPMTLFDGWE